MKVAVFAQFLLSLVLVFQINPLSQLTPSKSHTSIPLLLVVSQLCSFLSFVAAQPLSTG
jgi:hypothetical protein